MFIHLNKKAREILVDYFNQCAREDTLPHELIDTMNEIRMQIEENLDRGYDENILIHNRTEAIARDW